ncbi:hypothetical protein, partial [Paracoccus versutus]|uniref:hypothetical protein n=1 Tax=Paracoccus versutus TaxID=34007 RepID=UPI0015F06759
RDRSCHRSVFGGVNHAAQQKSMHPDPKLSCPDFKRTNQRFISEDKLHQLIEPLLNITQNLDIQSLIGQCITINLMIAGEVEQVFGLEPLLTIGWVELDNGEELFRVDENILLDNLTNRPETGSFNIHVWLGSGFITNR